MPFDGFLKRSFEQYVARNLPERDKFAFYFRELNKLDITYNSITPQKLIELIKTKSIKDSLYLFYTVFNSKNYWFSYDTFNYYLNQLAGLQEITISILRSSSSPMTINNILETIKRHHSVGSKYNDLASVIGNLKQNNNIYELDKHIFGVIDHFSYSHNHWKEITKDAIIYMQKIGRQTNAIELFQSLKVKYRNLRSKYELVYILRSDNQIEDLGFFNFVLKSMGFDERITVKDSIRELFTINLNPKHVAKIQEEILTKRFLRIEGMNTILKSQEYLKNYLGGFWGLRRYDENNLLYLVGSELYINKIISYEIFPDTSLDSILNIFGDNSFEKKLMLTIKNSTKLKVYNGVEAKPFVISKSWTMVKIVRCILFNIKREIYWDELLWIVKDFNLAIDNNSKSKIKNDKNITINGNKLSYFKISLKKNDIEDIVEICYELLFESVKQRPIEYIYEELNNEYIEITKDELLLLLENDDRFLLVDKQLIMVK